MRAPEPTYLIDRIIIRASDVTAMHPNPFDGLLHIKKSELRLIILEEINIAIETMKTEKKKKSTVGAFLKDTLVELYAGPASLTTKPTIYEPIPSPPIHTDNCFKETDNAIRVACRHLDEAPDGDPSRAIIMDLLDAITSLKWRIEKLQRRQTYE